MCSHPLLSSHQMTDQVQVAKMNPWRYKLVDPWSSDESGELSPRGHDKYLPIYNISNIMKKGLPPYGKISKNAKETLQECVSEFISFITNAASDKCQKENRKTLHGEDVLWAMTALGFEEYIDPLKIYLDRYREVIPRLRMPFQEDKPPNNKPSSGQASELNAQRRIFGNSSELLCRRSEGNHF